MSPFAVIGRGIGRLPGPVQAAFWVMASGTTYISMIAIARILSPELHIFEIVLFRSLFGLIFMAPLILRRGPGGLGTRKLPWFAFRSVFAFTTLAGTFTAATMIPLGDIMAINFTRPIFAAIAAVVILGEVARLRRWVAIAAGFVGALLIIRPGFEEINPGVFLVLLAVVAATAVAILVKYLTRTEHPDTIAIYHAVFLGLIALLPALVVWRTPNLEQLLWLLAMGLLGAWTQRAFSRAYAAADATVVVTLEFTRLPIAALIGFILFSEFPDIWVWLGGAVIFLAALYLTQRESRAQGPAGSV